MLSKTPGATRFAWDLRGPDPDALPYSYYGNILDYTEYTFADHAIPMDTPRVQPQGPLAAPGSYRCIDCGRKGIPPKYTVSKDPRIHATDADLEDQFAWAQKTTRGMSATSIVFHRIACVARRH